MTIKTCATCWKWSPWLPALGDCMSYAIKRQAEFILADDIAAFHRDWPQRPARETEPGDTCDDWEERTG